MYRRVSMDIYCSINLLAFYHEFRSLIRATVPTIYSVIDSE